MQDNISSTVPREDMLCPKCQNTRLLEVVSGDKERPVVFMGCDQCKKPNLYNLPRYNPEFELVERWDKWSPNGSYSFDELTQKWLKQVNSSIAFWVGYATDNFCS